MATVRQSRRTRRGWTLLAVAVTVMVIATLAAVAVPVIRGADAVSNAQRTAVMLESLDSSLTSSNGSALLKGACLQLATCPHYLHNLDTTIISGSSTTPECNGLGNFKNGDVTSWQASAPFSGYPIVTGYGLHTPLGWVHDTIVRTSKDHFELHLDSLTADEANYLDLAIDGTADANNGTLQYTEQAAVFTATGQHRYLAMYRRNVAKSCP